jgi:hypothetical protein
MTSIFNKLVSRLLSKNSDAPKNSGNPRVDPDGSQRWFKNGNLHRDDDLPASIWADGSKFWYKDGERHREGDKPAAIWADGSRFWYKEGKLHREGDKPAAIYRDGSQAWFKNGGELSTEEVEELKRRETFKRSLKDPGDVETGMKIFDL